MLPTLRQPCADRSGPLVITSLPDLPILPDSVGIIGLGAIGGSVAWRATRAGVRKVVGYSRSLGDTMEALKQGAISEPADSPEAAVRGAALVLVAAPPIATRELLGRLAPRLGPDTLVTDVASVKRSIVQAAIDAGLGSRFAGSHPLAGTHLGGFTASSPDLLHRAVVYVCPTDPVTGDRAARAISGFWQRTCEADPVLIDPARHDAQLAWTSHLPQAVASALARAIAERRQGGVSFGAGARDTMRLAGSDPELWAEILLENADPVAEAIQASETELARLRELLRSRDAAGLLGFLADAARFRRGLDR